MSAKPAKLYCLNRRKQWQKTRNTLEILAGPKRSSKFRKASAARIVVANLPKKLVKCDCCRHNGQRKVARRARHKYAKAMRDY